MCVRFKALKNHDESQKPVGLPSPFSTRGSAAALRNSQAVLARNLLRFRRHQAITRLFRALGDAGIDFALRSEVLPGRICRQDPHASDRGVAHQKSLRNESSQIRAQLRDVFACKAANQEQISTWSLLGSCVPTCTGSSGVLPGRLRPTFVIRRCSFFNVSEPRRSSRCENISIAVQH